MVRRHLAVLFLLGIISVGSLSSSWAETLVQQNVDTRVVVALRVSQAEAQNWLPAPWQVDPVASGPSKDANLLLVFLDRALNLDAEGKPVAGGTDRGLALVIPAKHAQTGEAAPYVIRVFTVNPQLLPGPYKNSALVATVRREQTLKGTDLDAGVGTEAWEIRDTAGGMIDLRLQYQRAVPARSKPEAKVRGGPDPNFFRLYRVDQGTDVVKSIPVGVDRVQSYQLQVTMAELRKLFDGSEQLVSIAILPWYVRQVFLP
ncbi:MAG: hypothetical protein ACREQW_00665 [Candidatus Binatia bacterium]